MSILKKITLTHEIGYCIYNLDNLYNEKAKSLPDDESSNAWLMLRGDGSLKFVYSWCSCCYTNRSS